MKALRLVPILVLVLSSIAIGTGAGAAGAARVPAKAYDCTGTGTDIPPGSYSSITVSGTCYMPAGTINVFGNVDVQPGALLDATTPGDPSSAPLLPANLTVGGNIRVGTGAVLLLGCSPFISCPSAITYDTVVGNLTAHDALGVLAHSTSIGGNVDIESGGGGTTCASEPPLWLSDPALANGEGPGNPLPVYTDFEDVTIGGNFSMTGLQTCWLGALRDQVGGDVTISHNFMADPDADEIDNDLVGGNMTCFGNSPQVQFGDSGASPNIVDGSALDECGFGVIIPNPGVQKGSPFDENITVSASSLGTYTGTHTVTAAPKTKVLGKTASGYIVAGSKEKVTLAGAGLTGSFTEKVLSDQAIDGSSQFYAIDKCLCGFDGQTGGVALLATGTTTSDGTTTGTFQVISGGGSKNGTGSPNPLSSLAGWGTFTSAGEPSGTLSLTEYLSNT